MVKRYWKPALLGAVLAVAGWLVVWYQVYDPTDDSGLSDFILGLRVGFDSIPAGNIIGPALFGAVAGWLIAGLVRDNSRPPAETPGQQSAT